MKATCVKLAAAIRKRTLSGVPNHDWSGERSIPRAVPRFRWIWRVV